MSDDIDPITVYFTCPGCLLPYRATQVRCGEPVSGHIDCMRCRGLVHQWTGYYDFIDWRPEASPNSFL